MKPAIKAPKRSEWQAWVTQFLRHYDAMDRALVAAGFPATSPWWRQHIERFLRRGCRRWVIRAGRRAGKSSTLARLAVAWAKWGPWSVPPGDIAVVAFVSVDREEAGARLRTVAAVLTALGVPFDQRSDEIELRERRLVFRVTTCSVRSVGFTSVMLIGDEMARWENRDTATNPAEQVMSSLRPTGATQPFWLEICVSSAWGTDDYHAQLFDKGDTEHQAVSEAKTWEANPTVSEADTHVFEPDLKVWQREYNNEPSATVSAAFDSADHAACYGRFPTGGHSFNFLTTDASSLRGDDFAWLEGYQTTSLELVVTDARGFGGADLRNVTMRDVVKQIAARAHALGVHTVYGDQREDASLQSMFAEEGVRFDPIPWTEVSKDDAFQALRRLMRDRKMILPDHAQLRRECETVKARLMPSGRIKYDTNGKDYLSALVTLAHRVVSGHIGVPLGEPFDYAARSDEISRQIYGSEVGERASCFWPAGGDYSGSTFQMPLDEREAMHRLARKYSR
jgi:hypothetical protein